MKKHLFCFVISLSLASFGGWSNSEVAQLYVDVKWPETLVLDNPVDMSGRYISYDVWYLGAVKTTDGGITWVFDGKPPTTRYTNFKNLLLDGYFDDETSIDYMLSAFNVEVYDEMEEKNVKIYADAPLVEFYWKEMDKNISTFISTCIDVSSKMNAKVEEIKQDTTSSGGSSGLSDEDAQSIDKMKGAVEAQKNQVKEQVEELRDAAEDTTKSLRQAEIDLAAYNTEKSEAASERVSEALNSLNSAMSQLDLAIASSDYSALHSVNAKLTDTIDALNLSKNMLDEIPSVEYNQARNNILSAISVISAAKLNISKAYSTHDMSYARSARNSLNGLSGLSNIKKAIRHGDIMELKAQGQAAKLSDKLNGLISLIDSYSDLYSAVAKIERELETLCQQYMNDMNTIGAYLGSTNAMQYFSEKRKWKDSDTETLKRWMKFSTPEKIKGSPSYYGDFNVGGKNWYSVFHNLQSEYFLQALPFDAESKLLDHFGMTSMSSSNMRGFYELPDDPPSTVTNWYANKITAPANWVDNSTIIVTNGKFRVMASETTPWRFENGQIKHCIVQVGYNTYTRADYTPENNGDYYCHISVTGALSSRSVNITINQSSTGGANDINFKVCSVTNRVVSGVSEKYSTYSLNTMPIIGVYE